MPVSFPKPDRLHALERVVTREIEILDGFRAQLEEQHQSELKKLEDVYGEEDDGIEFLADESYVLDEVLDLGGQLAIVALYRIVELKTSKMLGWKWTEVDIKKMNLYKADSLAKALRRELGIDIKALLGFAAVDELRLLNNAIKHQGRVSAQLAKYPGWVEGEPLRELGAAYTRLAPSVPGYLKALAGHLFP